jgi:hypothetical protein
MVFKNEFDTIGKPVIWNGMYKRGDNLNEIRKGEKWFLELPWHETRGTEMPFDFNNLIRVFQHFFKGNNQPYLAKGKYFSEFKQQFCLGRHLPDSISQQICTDTLQFKINFEIK